MRFTLKELSVVTGIPYRTLQDYEYGKRGIPGRVAVLMRDEAARCKRIRQQIMAGIDRRVQQEFPSKFMSEVEADDLEAE